MSSLYPLFGNVPVSPPKRRIFISHYHGDRDEVNEFIQRWSTIGSVFTPKALGYYDNDDFINSEDSDYVMSEIRRRYIDDASVTIVLIGKCTHSRKYVDWEIKSSLTRGQSIPNGILALVLPSAMPPERDYLGRPIEWTNRAWPALPPRLAENYQYGLETQSYANYYVMPNSIENMRDLIEKAVLDRANKANLIKNSNTMMIRNAQCKHCGIYH